MATTFAQGQKVFHYSLSDDEHGYCKVCTTKTVSDASDTVAVRLADGRILNARAGDLMIISRRSSCRFCGCPVCNESSHITGTYPQIYCPSCDTYLMKSETETKAKTDRTRQTKQTKQTHVRNL